jgi:thiol-disulfide isomerase/thioredoxin
MKSAHWSIVSILTLAAAIGGAAGCNQSTGTAAPTQANQSTKSKTTPPGASRQGKSGAVSTQAANDERFKVPEGPPDELLAFIEKLAKPEPFKTDEEVRAYHEGAVTAISTAADRVLAGEPTEQQAGDAIQWKLESFKVQGELGDTRASIAAEKFLNEQHSAKRVETRRAAARVRLDRELARSQSQDAAARAAILSRYADAVKANGLSLTDARLLASLAELCSKQLFLTSDAAAAPFRELLPLFRDHEDPKIAERAKLMEGIVRRLELPGKKLELSGTLLDGTPLDWNSYRGKVVLVDFWATDCEDCMREMPNLVRHYKMYRDKGFAVLGVNLNRDAAEVKKVVDENGMEWPHLFEAHSGEERWVHPMADHLAIDGIPQMVLVDKEGTVVHMHAQGATLGEELKKLLGEPAMVVGFNTTVPDGSVPDILQFVEDQIRMLTPPRNMDEQRQNREKVRTLFTAAVDKILAGEPSVDEAAQAIEMKLTALRFSDQRPEQIEPQLSEFLKRLDASPRPAVAAAAAEIQLLRAANNWDLIPPAERSAVVDRYVELAKEWGPSSRHVATLMELVQYVSLTKDEKIAARAISGVLPLFSDRSDPKIAERAEVLEGMLRRMNLPGVKLELEGTLMDGTKLDWAAYRGKVVLVDFWASWCGPCRQEVPNIIRNLDAYRDKGFEVLGICLDDERAPAEAYIKQAGVTWPSIIAANPEEAGFQHPISKRYGITGIPIAILVDRDGTVVSLLARGPMLGRELQQLLGDAATPQQNVK